jgi:Plasmid recombination enzyme
MNAQFAILRTAKLKTIGNVAGSLAHTFRTRETANADPHLSHENEHSHENADEIVQALKARLPEKRRKDAVLGLEFFVGASPQWFEDKGRDQQDRYFRDAVTWLEKRHGKENVLGWSIHRDESTPHLVAYVIPLDEKGKLNAKKWTGGAATLSRMQTDFARQVGERHRLVRGIEGSKAHHQTIKSFYAQINEPSKQATISPQAVEPKVLKKGFLSKTYETHEMVAERITTSVRNAYAPAVAGSKLVAMERKRAAEMTRTAQKLTQSNKSLQNELKALYKHLAPVMELATLAKDEFAQLLNQTQLRVKTLKAEKEKIREKINNKNKDNGISR